MVFSCTKKVRDKIKKYQSIEDDKVEVGLSNWYVDLIVLERRSHFLFTNSKTLFSFFVYAGTKNEFKKMGELFEKKLEEQIIREVGSNPKYLEILLAEGNRDRYVKTNSRSVLGSINDFKYQISVHVEYDGGSRESYDKINHLLNKVPMKMLKYKYPVEVMREELESLIR